MSLEFTQTNSKFIDYAVLIDDLLVYLEILKHLVSFVEDLLVVS